MAAPPPCVHRNPQRSLRLCRLHEVSAARRGRRQIGGRRWDRFRRTARDHKVIEGPEGTTTRGAVVVAQWLVLQLQRFIIIVITATIIITGKLISLLKDRIFFFLRLDGIVICLYMIFKVCFSRD